MSIIPVYNGRIASAGKTTIEFYPWGDFKQVVKMEIGKQVSGNKEELIDSIMHEELEVRFAKTHNRNEMMKMTDGEIHDIINKEIQAYFERKGWDYGKVR